MNHSGGDIVDTTVASVARVYDYMLGGKDNFAVDREYARSIVERDPSLAVSVRLNKQFGSRVVQYMALRGVTQFLDLGSGIPTSPPSVHDTARQLIPEPKVVYVDNDPVVAKYNRSARSLEPSIAVLQEDFLDPDSIFDHPDLRAIFDLDQPVGVLYLSVLQNSTTEQIARAMAGVRSRLTSGSMIAINHVSHHTSEGVKEQNRKATEKGQYPRTFFRSDEEIAEMLRGTELVSPGVIDYRDWRPPEIDKAERPDLNLRLSAAVGVIS